MIAGLKKPLRHLTSSELSNRPEDASARKSAFNRRISLGLLEEAEKLAKRVGQKEACRQAGISLSSLAHFIRAKDGGFKNRRFKISPAKKQECFRMANRLKEKGFSKCMRKCWIEAGNRLGISGRSVEFQYVRGLWTPTL